MVTSGALGMWVTSSSPVETNLSVAKGLLFFKKWANPGLFSIYFYLFKHILQKINVKNVHPVYSAGIWIHDLLNISVPP